MIKLPIYQVDAFTRSRFRGNPAAVCPLESWLPDAVLQEIAAENNQPMTAFFVSQGDGFALRWFLPKGEENLCGHATLAAAHVLVNHRNYLEPVIRFVTKSGPLSVRRVTDRLELDFPVRPMTPVTEPPPALIAGLGATPRETGRAMDWVAVFDDEESIRAIAPDFRTLAQLDGRGVIVTAPGREVDFVSRFFAPRDGLDEDPVTGSAHCTLIPYWASRLARPALHARQISARGGELWCELAGDRVKIGGHAVTYLIGEITV
jgi:predicted PhzF superfamily epimerase YddE/YHI9